MCRAPRPAAASSPAIRSPLATWTSSAEFCQPGCEITQRKRIGDDLRHAGSSPALATMDRPNKYIQHWLDRRGRAPTPVRPAQDESPPRPPATPKVDKRAGE